MRSLQRIIACAVFIASVSTAVARADSTPQPVGHDVITVAGDRVAYYADTATLQARGHVRVSLPDGAVVQGDAFSMDLSLRRLIVVGHLLLRAQGVSYIGAAFADFLPYRRGYFVPLDPNADRWTFLDSDYGHPEMGRMMPGDAFFLPDLSASRPFIIARSATIDPTTFVKFVPANVTLLDGPMTPPLPSFVDNFSQNQNFGINTLSGATFDAPYAFSGSANSLDAIHLRYDQTREVKTFLSFEHHSVFGDGGYAVFSLNPATQLQKQWNLLGYDRTGPLSAVALSAQLFTVQSGLLQPSTSNGFADVQITRALPESSVRLDVTQSYDNLLNDAVTPNHPFVAGVTWSGFDQPVARTGLTFRLRSGIATDHDVYGVSTFPQRDVWARFLDATLYSPIVNAPFHTSANASYDAQRTWSSFPNEVRWDTLTVSDGARLADKLFAVATTVISTVHVDDVSETIVSPNLSTGFTAQPASANGLPTLIVPTGFRNTVSRIYALTTTWQPSTSFQFGLSLQQDRYSPKQLPSPYQLTAAFRTRLTRTLFVDVGRSYYFNFQHQGWTPQFTLQVSSQ